MLCRQTFSNRHAAYAALTGLLEEWTGHLQIHRLAHYGIAETDFERIVANCRGSSMKTNPVVLTDAEIGTILHERL